MDQAIRAVELKDAQTGSIIGGIKEEDKSRIFKDFYRAENAREFNGTGLGLSVTREFLNLNNCKIDLKSEIGQGSTFTIIFNHVN